MKALLKEMVLEEKFKRCLLEAIDGSMFHILGETATQTIYFHLEHNERLKREDIPDNLEEFLFTLERIFSVGALVIEKTIMKNLYSRLSFENKNLRLKYKKREQFNFIDYINEVKKHVCQRQAGV